MDVNSNLTGTTSVKALCGMAQTQLEQATAATTLPRVCQDTNDHTTVACTTANSVPVAFVLYSTGSDHMPDQENGTAANQIYENDNRGIDNSAGANHYDDQVVSYPLSSLVAACAKVGGLPVCNLNATPSTSLPVSLPRDIDSELFQQPTAYNWSTPPAGLRL